jgi:hypothetical protein
MLVFRMNLLLILGLICSCILVKCGLTNASISYEFNTNASINSYEFITNASISNQMSAEFQTLLHTINIIFLVACVWLKHLTLG